MWPVQCTLGITASVRHLRDEVTEHQQVSREWEWRTHEPHSPTDNDWQVRGSEGVSVCLGAGLRYTFWMHPQPEYITNPFTTVALVYFKSARASKYFLCLDCFPPTHQHFLNVCCQKSNASLQDKYAIAGYITQRKPGRADAQKAFSCLVWVWVALHQLLCLSALAGACGQLRGSLHKDFEVGSSLEGHMPPTATTDEFDMQNV